METIRDCSEDFNRGYREGYESAIIEKLKSNRKIMESNAISKFFYDLAIWFLKRR